MPVLWLALLSPLVLLVVMLAMDRVEQGLSDPEPDTPGPNVI
ncbi:MAG TPA: hypothetical protein VM097_00355 [Mycobacteriales bacterium]|nr:hypothetical protein [Mycobacteriales bacterium]